MTATHRPQPPSPPLSHQPVAVGPGGALCGSGGSADLSVLRDPSDEPRSVDEDRQRALNRYAGRRVQQRMLGLMGLREHRLATCGFSMNPGREFRVVAGRARSTGVEQCGNARVCQVCGPAVAAQRAAEVGAAVWRHLEVEDNDALFLSFAPAHTRDDRLEDLAGMLLDARADVMNPECSTWRKLRRQRGIVDVAWTLEASIGPNGPHPGLHVVLLFDHQVEAEEASMLERWFYYGLRASLIGLGYRHQLMRNAAIDLRQVDDPAGLGKYLTKWGIGAEVAGEMSKLGRNGVNVPYSAIPAVLAQELGRQDLRTAMRHSPRVAGLVAAWEEFVRFALTCKRKWYGGFRRLSKLVPELKGVTGRNDRIAICVDVLPVELRPARHDDAEEGEADDDPAEVERLTVDADAWAAAQRAWWGDRARLPATLVNRWRCSPAPLELVVCWLLEDDGLDAAAGAVADLAGGAIRAVGAAHLEVTVDDPACNPTVTQAVP